jgi:hypothetical protein
MKTMLRVLPITLLLVLAACRTAPVYTVESEGLGSPPNAKMSQVTKAIKRAGAGLGWAMKTRKAGHLVGSLAVRSHRAVVDIRYNTKTFSITYKDSQNLKYDGTNIHNNYNGWIQRLRNAILAQASAI